MKQTLKITQIERDFSIKDLSATSWEAARDVTISTYWNGKTAPLSRQFRVRLLWSNSALYVRFLTTRSEPLIISEKPDLTKKTIGLWERDVCEIFLAPESNEPNRYFEFEIAPTGEWIDLGIEVLPSERRTDWDYHSGMESAARIEKEKVVMAIKIPWAAFGRKPKAGDVWLGNIFRCVGKDPARGYLAWQPTMTPWPNFHVPERFGKLLFDK